MDLICCVEECSNNNENNDPNNPVSFYEFPSDNELKLQWLEAIGRLDWDPPAEARVCSAHFVEEQSGDCNESEVEPCTINDITNSNEFLELLNQGTATLEIHDQDQPNAYKPKYNSIEKCSYVLPETITDINNGGFVNYVINYEEESSDDNKIIIPYKKFEDNEYKQMYLEVKEELQDADSNEELYYDSDDIYGSEVSDDRSEVKDVLENDFEEEHSQTEGTNKDYYVLYVENEDEKEIKPSIIKNENKKDDEVNCTITNDELQEFFKVENLTLEQQLEDWKQVENKTKPIYEIVNECVICSKIFTHYQVYQQHLLNHDSVDQQAECPICKLHFKNQAHVDQHVKWTHAIKYSCTLCSKIFNNRRIAKTHQGWHLTNTNEYSDKFQVLRLSERAKDQLLDVKSGQTSRCKLCKITFPTERALRVHLLQSAIHRKKYGLSESVIDEPALRTTCRRCGEVLPSTGALAAHVRAAHRARLASPADRAYPVACDHCGETIQTRRAHYWHYIRQHPMESYQPVITAVCETCGKGFQNPTKLQIHELRHSQPQVSCAQCGGRFYDKYALARHMSVHNDDRPYQCQRCHFTFKQKGNLLRHAKVHSTERAYQCSLCEKTFKYTTSMNLHIRTVHYHMPHPPRKKKQIKKRKPDPSPSSDNIVHEIE